MDYLIIGFVFLAFVHFVYESILAPSFRLKKKFELFRLRDELRQAKIDLGSELDDKHFHHLQNSINSLIRHLPVFDLATLVKAKIDMESDKELRTRVEAHSRVLDDCRVESVKSIRRNSLRAARAAFVVNMGIWVIYIFPIALFIAFFSGIKNVVKSLLSMSEPDFQKVSHVRDGRSLGVV